ncbi:hypothetical protein P0F65_21560 [Sphingomonas sp. I4]
MSLATRTPRHRLSQDQALATARELIGDRFTDFDRLAPIFANAGIAERQLAMPLDWYRTPARSRSAAPPISTWRSTCSSRPPVPRWTKRA